MLVNFDTLAKRPYVKDFAHKNSEEMVLKLFKDEIKEVEDTFKISQRKQFLCHFLIQSLKVLQFGHSV